MIQLLPPSAFAQNSAENLQTPSITEPAAEQADSAQVLSEDVSKRDEFYKEFILDNGLRLATIYPTAVHYEQDGQWADIDNTLTMTAVRGQAVYTNTAGPWQVQFPRQLSGSNAISLTKDGYTVSFAMAGELRTGSGFAVASANQTVTRANASTARVQQVDMSALKAEAEFEETILDKLYARVQYDGVYAGTNVVYDLDGARLKESVILRSYDATLRGYRYELNTGGLIPVLNQDQSIELRDPNTDTVVMTMPAPFMLDAADEYCDRVQVDLVPRGENYLLVYQLPAEWLAEPERAWPVILDPIISANNDRTNIQDITVAQTGTESNNATTIKCGYHLTKGILRTYLRFKELPKLTSSDVIVKAEVSLVKPYDSDLSAAIEVHKVTAPWQASETDWSNKPVPNDTVEDITVVQNPATYTWNITDIARSWYADTANTLGNNTGMMFKAVNAIETGGTKNWQQFCSSDFGSDRPLLTILYRATAGLESYWDTSSSAAGRAGTGYIQNYSGNLVWVHSDMGFGGNRMPVSINHIYNAGLAWETDTNASANPFGLGNGWRTNYHQRIIALSGIDYIWEDGDGTRHEFRMTSSDVFLDKDGLHLTLKKSADGYTLTDKYGNTSTFDSQGHLIHQTDNQASPSSVTITYENSRISNITDGVGRKYEFTYKNGLLDKITYYGSGTAALYEVEYTYVGTELAEIIYQDGKVANFAYTDKSLLSSVTDIDGYTLSYTYNTLENGKPSRVASVTEYSAGQAGGTTTLSYGDNCTTLADEDNSQTHFFNTWGNTVSIQNSQAQGTFASYATEENEYADPHRLRESSQQQVTVTNLIKDSSFENSTLWTSGSSAVSCSIVTNQQHIGQKSMRSYATSGGVTGPTISTNYALAGESYTFSAYVKSVGGAVSLRAGIGTATAKSQTLSVGTDWTRLEVTVTNNTEEAQPITVSLFHESPGTAYIDCVQLENANGASRYNLIDNSDFQYSGNGWTFTGGTYPTGDNDTAPKLNNAVICMSGNTAEVRSITQTLPLSGEEGDMYVFAGWAKGDAMAIKDNRAFRLVLTFHNTDGTTTAIPVNFNENLPSGQWQYAARGAVATKAYSSITLRAEYAYQAGTAYFDGIQLYKEGFGTRYAYDANGNVTQTRDILGQITEYFYDYKNDLTKIIYPTKVEEYSEYDTYHNLTESTQRVWVEDQEETEEGNWEQTTVTTYEYDDWGNLTKTTVSYELTGETPQSLTMTTESIYTADGNYLHVAKDELGNATTYEYDPQTGVLLSVKQPEDTPNSITTYTYDSMYRLKSVSEGSSGSGTVSYAYQFDLLSSISKPGTSYTLSYNGHNDLAKISVGTSVLAVYSYTNDSNRYLSSLAYGNGDVVEYTYDDLGRVTKEEYFENESETASRTVTYTYNESGVLAKMTDSKTGMTTTYTYDPLGRLVSSYETDGTSKKSSSYAYYGTGDLKAESYLINSTRYSTVYEYDALRRVTKVQNGDLTSDYEYDIFSRLAKKTTSVGETKVIEEYIDYKSPSEGATSNQIAVLWVMTNQDCVYYQYAYDDNGRIVGEVRVQGTRNADTEAFPVSTSKKYSTSYSYNPMDWLTREDNQLAGKTWIWTYDPAGNITSKKEYPYGDTGSDSPLNTITYTYGNSNWGDLLTSYNGRTITYDAIGNPLNDGIWSYTWEQGRQLTKMQSSSATWNYTYDTSGLRTQRSNGTTTYRYWYNDNGLLLRMEKGSTVYSFTYDPAGRPVSISDGNTRYYYVLNQQGDVVGLMNGNKKLVVEYIYDAWGRLISTTGTLATTLGTNNPLRYRGYVYDTETALYYLQSRYYNPEMGRFINADKQLGTDSVVGLNLFAYCNNNPVNLYDPNGELAITTLILIGSAIFGIAVGGYTAYVEYNAGFSWDKIIYDSICVGLTAFSVAYTGGMSLYQCYQNFCYLNGLTPITDIGGRANTCTALQPYYPPNNGFLGMPQKTKLEAGTLLQRTGNFAGRFVAPAGTPQQMLSLPYDKVGQPTTIFQVQQTVEALGGRVAPWFGQMGGGTQYLLLDGRVDELLREGILTIFGG